MHPADEDDDPDAGAARATHAGYAWSAGPARPDAKLPDERTLLREIWQIGHFGWIPEVTIRRGLTLAGGQELSAGALARRLQLLLELGWAEQRDGDTGEREWRLTDSGRNAH
jgi:hypothetical protein